MLTRSTSLLFGLFGLACAACSGKVVLEGSGGTGGSGATTTTTTTTGSGGTSAAPDCESPADCQLVNDCCACEALPADITVPACPQTCIQPECSAIGFPNAAASCVAGRCVAGFDCDPLHVVCNGIPPTCAPGLAPSVVGACWGGCVQATQCTNLPDCSACDPASEACVRAETELGPQYHCVESHGLAPDCAHLGASVCVSPFDLCSVNQGIITCACPACG